MGGVGPMGADGSVEIPVGSGYRYPTLGMLSKHPQYVLLRALLKAQGFGDWPDEPMVADKFCPRGTAYVSPGWGAVFVNPYAEIERVVVIPGAAAEALYATAPKPAGLTIVAPGSFAFDLPGWERWCAEHGTSSVVRAEIESAMDADRREVDREKFAQPPALAPRLAGLLDVDPPCYVCGASNASGKTPLREKCRGPR